MLRVPQSGPLVEDWDFPAKESRFWVAVLET